LPPRQIGADFLLECGRGQSAVRAGVDRHAFLRTAFPAGQHGLPVHTRGIPGIDHRDDRNPEHFGELEIPRIVRRHRHDGSRAIADQHIVGDPDRHFLVIDRIDGIRAGEHAGLFLVFLTLAITAGRGPGAIRGDRRLLAGRGQTLDEGVLRGDDHVGRTEQCIRTRGVDSQHFVGGLPRITGQGPARFPSCVVRP